MLDLPHEIRDPVASLIRLSDLEWKLISTCPFQRLRGIKQLALADLVYPGCVHNRFLHSIGTLAMTDAIWTRLAAAGQIPNELNNPEQRQLVRLAGLLHDIGHGPFSHVAEYLLEQFVDRAALPGNISTHKIHETITADIIRSNSEIRDILGSDLIEEIVTILKPSLERDFRRDIVSSGLDADKLDYLTRDGAAAGVEYGRVDIEKILDSFRVVEVGADSYLGIHEDGRFAVEQLILAKWHMTQQVYGHRVRVITDSMIVRGLELSIEDGDEQISELFSYQSNAGYVSRYLDWDDSVIFGRLLSSEAPSARANEIFRRLRDRNLYKEILMISLDEVDVPDFPDREALLRLKDDRSTQIDRERQLSEALGVDDWETIVLHKNIRNPAYSDQERLDPEAIPVISRDGRVRYLQDYGDRDLLSLQNAIPGTDRFHVIAPEVTDRDGDLRNRIRSILVGN